MRSRVLRAAVSILACVFYFMMFGEEYLYRLVITSRLNSIKLNQNEASDCREIESRFSRILSATQINHYESSQLVDPLDVTLITHLSCDRKNAFFILLDHWQGPVSVAVYCNEKDAETFVQMVKDYHYKHHVSISVVHSHHELEYYPVNT